MKALFLGLFFFLPALAFAQNYYDSTATKQKVVFVTLRDGTSLRGQILPSSGNQVRLKTENLGEVTLEMTQIAEIREADGFTRNGRFYGRNPFYISYFASPAASTLRRGEGVYQNTYVFMNSVNFGVTDHLTMGGGFLLIPGTGTTKNFFVTPKVCLNPNGRVRVGIGTLLGVFFVRNYTGFGNQRENRTEVGGIAYGNVTFGDQEKNGTIGLGWGYGNGEIGRQPVVSASYMARAGRKVAFITDNFMITAAGETVGLVSAGLRIFGERIGGDIAIYTPIGGDLGRLFILPFASLKVKFGREKNGLSD
ncbi:MAG: hypothetical protein LH606_19255 [Cytophagaceae bacterium]|nr:hypothetical protein [Cytophagaceae bacterium]